MHQNTQPNALASALDSLTASGKNISLSARIKANIISIEKAIESGVPMRDIVATLNDNGIPISEKSFPMTIYRIRSRIAKKRGENIQAAPSAAVQAMPVSREEFPESTGFSQHTSRADLETIIHGRPDMQALAKAARNKK